VDVREPAADLAVAAALLSSLTGTVIPPGTAVFGEIALSGAIRPVGQTEARLVVMSAVVFALGAWVFGRLSPRFAEEM
jgi:DNA repair protein RadA/Sms